MIVKNERNKATNDTTHVENTPEERDISPFTMSRWVRGHDSALTSPEKTCTDTQESSGDNGESLVLVMVVVEERAGIEDVGGAACEKGKVGTEYVVDATTQDAKESEAGEEGGVGVVSGGVVDLAATTHAWEGIVHAGTTEADKAYEADLNERWVVPELGFGGEGLGNWFFFSIKTHRDFVSENWERERERENSTRHEFKENGRSEFKGHA